MACNHAQSCPLFPHLRASLAGWKTSYCDSDENWATCARHRTSSMGKPVPITLLPNGTLVTAAALDRKPVGGTVATLEDDRQPTVVSQSLWRRIFGRRS